VPEDAEAPNDNADPRDAAAALLDHLDRDEERMRLLVGDDAPTQVALALDRRREDYTRDPRFTRPSPVGSLS
jgi:hypothetical protein